MMILCVLLVIDKDILSGFKKCLLKAKQKEMMRISFMNGKKF